MIIMTNRRNFVKQMLLGGAALSSLKWVHANESSLPYIKEKSSVDEIRIALICKGGMGTADANCALQIPGVKIVAVCDVY